MTPEELRAHRRNAAKFYADQGRQRFYVFGWSRKAWNDERSIDWQVREDHEYLGIDGGSGLMGSFADRETATKEAARLNALDAEALS